MLADLREQVARKADEASHRRKRLAELGAALPDATPDQIEALVDEELGLDFDDPNYSIKLLRQQQAEAAEKSQASPESNGCPAVEAAHQAPQPLSDGAGEQTG
jgi:hypothetical protein